MRARLFARVFTLQALKLMSYRVDFWITALATVAVELVIVYVLWSAMFRETGRREIGGFTLGGMIAYYVLVLLVGKLVRGTERDYTTSSDIYEGGLTRYLLYPTPYFGFKYAEHLGNLLPGLVQLALFGGAALFLLPVAAEISVTPGAVAMAAVSVLIGNLLNFLMVYPLQLVAFWADNVWSLSVMLRFVVAMLGGQMLPLTLFPEWAQRVLALLPFQYLFYFPVTTLLGGVGFAEWAAGTAVALAWCAVVGLAARGVWRRGLRSYTGVGI
jgi:ABC-2 type transport system permease protein